MCREASTIRPTDPSPLSAAGGTPIAPEGKNVPNTGNTRSREPWLAASFSWVLPGAGHLYCNAYGVGVLLLIVAVLLYTLWIASLISARTSLSIAVSLGVLSRIVLPASASFMAHRYYASENKWPMRRDPWLAVFLNILLPGIGHLFLRKWVTGVIVLFGYLVLLFLSGASIYAVIGAALVHVLAPLHVLTLSRSPGSQLLRPSMLPVAALLCLLVIEGALVPLVTGYFILENTKSASGPSMAPTIPDGARLTLDKVTYRWRSPAAGDIVAL